MGRVVKNARVTGNAYTVRPPVVVPPPLPETDPIFAAFDDPIFGDAPVAAPLEEMPDFDALRAQAAEIIDNASADAEALLRDAKERSLELVQEAERRANELHETAKSQGFEQGVSDGRAAASAEMDEMLETMRGLIEMARAERHKIVEGAEPEVVRLSVAIAERVLAQHIAVDHETVVEMTRSAVSRLVSRESVTVRVNPADIETMRDHRDRIMSMNAIDSMRIIEDQRVDRGGVVLETEAGTIDAKVSTQLREVRRLLAVDDPLSVGPSSEPALINPPAQAS